MPDAADPALTDANLHRVSEIYARYGTGDRAFALDALADDVEWTSHGAGELPWGGTWRGRVGVDDYFSRVDQLCAITSYEIEQFIAQGEWVVALVRATGRFHATGEEIDLRKADALRMRDGKIVEFREYYDSAALCACVARCGGVPA